jgi:hypothetical protein
MAGMASEFVVGALYSRRDIAEQVNYPNPSDFNWTSGYTKHNGEFFIFCNVGCAGATGHDYPNRWLNDGLLWYGKTKTNISQPQIQQLLSGEFPVHLFWRGNTEADFTYAGRAYPLWAEEKSVPVEVLWSFDPAQAIAPAELAKTPVWKRGPPPWVGEMRVHRQDGPTKVYLMVLQGKVHDACPKLPSGSHLAKLGMSNSPKRRVTEMNVGFPAHFPFKWKLVRSVEYPSGQAAYEAEGKLLERCRREGKSDRGEFVVLSGAEVEVLLT